MKHKIILTLAHENEANGSVPDSTSIIVPVDDPLEVSKKVQEAINVLEKIQASVKSFEELIAESDIITQHDIIKLMKKVREATIEECFHVSKFAGYVHDGFACLDSKCFHTMDRNSIHVNYLRR